MRVFISLLVGLIAIVLTAALAIFAAQNVETVTLHFLPYSFTGSVWSIAVGAARLGVLVTILLMLPGRMAEILHDRIVDEKLEQASEEMGAAQRRQAGAEAARRETQQQSQRLQTQLRQLVGEREDLVAERDRLRAERNKYRHQLAITQTELTAIPGTGAAAARNTPSRIPIDADVDVTDGDEVREFYPYQEDDTAQPDHFDTNPSAEAQAAQPHSVPDDESDTDDQSPDEVLVPERVPPPKNQLRSLA